MGAREGRAVVRAARAAARRPLLRTCFFGCVVLVAVFGVLHAAVGAPFLDAGPSFVVSSLERTCGVMDGSVKCWGATSALDFGWPTRPAIGDDEPAIASTMSASHQLDDFAVGPTTVCTLATATSTIRCWSASSEEHPITAGMSPAGFFAAGAYRVFVGHLHACFTATWGDFWCWGSNANGQMGSMAGTADPSDLVPLSLGDSAPVSVALGEFHSCATDGTAKKLFCWGSNDFGRVGTGSSSVTRTPAEILPNDARDVAVGTDHTCVLRTSNSTVYCFGRGAGGRLGLANFSGNVGDNEPVSWSLLLPVPLDRPVAVLRAAGRTTCALLNGGVGVTCWGLPGSSILGVGAGVNSPDPVTGIWLRVQLPLARGVTVADVTVGDKHACALLNTGQLVCWGTSTPSGAALGLGWSADIADPMAEHSFVPLAFNVVGVRASGGTTCVAYSARGGLHCWGELAGLAHMNDSYVGDDELLSTLPSLRIGGDLLAVGMSASSVCFSVVDGTMGKDRSNDTTSVFCAGNPSSPADGYSSNDRIYAVGHPVNKPRFPWGQHSVTFPSAASLDLLSFTRVVQLAGGLTHMCGLSSQGAVRCWGLGLSGELGVPGVESIDSVVALAGVPAVRLRKSAISIGAAEGLSCAVLEEGTVQCWGEVYSLYSSSVVGDDEPASAFGALTTIGTAAAQVAVGSDFQCIIDIEGALRCWGHANSGVIDPAVGDVAVGHDDTGSHTAIPKLVLDDSVGDWFKVVASEKAACAIPSSKASLICWGTNFNALLANGEGFLATTKAQSYAHMPPVNFGMWADIVTDVAMGENHACAIVRKMPLNHTLFCWGDDVFGAVASPTPLGLFVGDSGETPATVGPVLLRSTLLHSVSVGWSHTCVLRSPSGLFCFGSNNYGQLGVPRGVSNITGNMTLLPDIPGSDTVVQVVCGAMLTCVRFEDGAVACFGRAATSILDPGGEPITSLTPVAFPDAADFLALGGSSLCAIMLEDRQLYCVFANDLGQLGLGDTSSRMAPERVPLVDLGEVDEDQRVAHVSITPFLSADRIMAVRFDGKVFAWGSKNMVFSGRNSVVRVGDDEHPAVMPPVLDVTTSGVMRTISVGNKYFCGLNRDHRVVCFGKNIDGRCGLGDALPVRRTVQPLPFYVPMTAVTVGDTHACAITRGKNLYCWGSKAAGALGMTSTNQYGDDEEAWVSPVVSIEDRIHSIAPSGDFTCARRGGVTPGVICFGNDDRVGITNSFIDRSETRVDHIFQNVVPSDNASFVADGITTGNNFACMWSVWGTVYCWGANTVGQLGIGSIDSAQFPTTATSRGIPVATVSARFQTACLLTAFGQVGCWGLNSDGQHGVGDFVNFGSNPGDNVTARVLSSTIPLMQQIAVGFSHVCGVSRSNATQLICWGLNSHGQLAWDEPNASPTPLPAMDAVFPIVQIVSGGLHSCVIRDNNTTRCWGYREMIGVPENEVNVRPTDPEAGPSANVNFGAGEAARFLAAGDTHTCAVTFSNKVMCFGSNEYGQTGKLGSIATLVWEPVLVPISVEEGEVPSLVSAGSLTTCVLFTSGRARCFGYEHQGSLGHANLPTSSLGDTVDARSFPPVYFGPRQEGQVTSVSAGADFTCVTQGNSNVVCFGPSAPPGALARSLMPSTGFVNSPVWDPCTVTQAGRLGAISILPGQSATIRGVDHTLRVRGGLRLAVDLACDHRRVDSGVGLRVRVGRFLLVEDILMQSYFPDELNTSIAFTGLRLVSSRRLEFTLPVLHGQSLPVTVVNANSVIQRTLTFVPPVVTSVTPANMECESFAGLMVGIDGNHFGGLNLLEFDAVENKERSPTRLNISVLIGSEEETCTPVEVVSNTRLVCPMRSGSHLCYERAPVRVFIEGVEAVGGPLFINRFPDSIGIVRIEGPYYAIPNADPKPITIRMIPQLPHRAVPFMDISLGGIPCGNVEVHADDTITCLPVRGFDGNDVAVTVAIHHTVVTSPDTITIFSTPNVTSWRVGSAVPFHDTGDLFVSAHGWSNVTLVCTRCIVEPEQLVTVAATFGSIHRPFIDVGVEVAENLEARVSLSVFGPDLFMGDFASAFQIQMDLVNGVEITPSVRLQLTPFAIENFDLVDSNCLVWPGARVPPQSRRRVRVYLRGVRNSSDVSQVSLGPFPLLDCAFAPTPSWTLFDTSFPIECFCPDGFGINRVVSATHAGSGQTVSLSPQGIAFARPSFTGVTFIPRSNGSETQGSSPRRVTGTEHVTSPLWDVLIHGLGFGAMDEPGYPRGAVTVELVSVGGPSMNVRVAVWDVTPFVQFNLSSDAGIVVHGLPRPPFALPAATYFRVWIGGVDSPYDIPETALLTNLSAAMWPEDFVARCDGLELWSWSDTRGWTQNTSFIDPNAGSCLTVPTRCPLETGHMLFGSWNESCVGRASCWKGRRAVCVELLPTEKSVATLEPTVAVCGSEATIAWPRPQWPPLPPPAILASLQASGGALDAERLRALNRTALTAREEVRWRALLDGVVPSAEQSAAIQQWVLAASGPSAYAPAAKDVRDDWVDGFAVTFVPDHGVSEVLLSVSTVQTTISLSPQITTEAFVAVRWRGSVQADALWQLASLPNLPVAGTRTAMRSTPAFAVWAAPCQSWDVEVAGGETASQPVSPPGVDDEVGQASVHLQWISEWSDEEAANDLPPAGDMAPLPGRLIAPLLGRSSPRAPPTASSRLRFSSLWPVEAFDLRFGMQPFEDEVLTVDCVSSDPRLGVVEPTRVSLSAAEFAAASEADGVRLSFLLRSHPFDGDVALGGSTGEVATSALATWRVDEEAPWRTEMDRVGVAAPFTATCSVAGTRTSGLPARYSGVSPVVLPCEVVNEVWPFFQDALSTIVVAANQTSPTSAGSTAGDEGEQGGEEDASAGREWLSSLDRTFAVSVPANRTRSSFLALSVNSTFVGAWDAWLRRPVPQSSFSLPISGETDVLLVADERTFLRRGRPAFVPGTRVWLGDLPLPVWGVSADGRYLWVRTPSYASLCPTTATCFGGRAFRRLSVVAPVRVPAEALRASVAATRVGRAVAAKLSRDLASVEEAEDASLRQWESVMDLHRLAWASVFGETRGPGARSLNWWTTEELVRLGLPPLPHGMRWLRVETDTGTLDPFPLIRLHHTVLNATGAEPVVQTPSLAKAESVGLGMSCPPACPGVGRLSLAVLQRFRASYNASIAQPLVSDRRVLDSTALASLPGQGTQLGVFVSPVCAGFERDPAVCLRAETATRCAYGEGDDCRACPTGALCPGGYRLWSQPGYWVASEQSVRVALCSPPARERCPWPSGLGVAEVQAFLGRPVGVEGVEVAENQNLSASLVVLSDRLAASPVGQTPCAAGYLQGIVGCAACEEGYFPASNGRCEACPSSGDDSTSSKLSPVVEPILTLLGSVLGIGFVVALVVVLVAKRMKASAKDGLKQTVQFLIWTVTVLQLVAQVGRTASAALPPSMRLVFDVLNVLQFDFSLALHPACLNGGPFAYEVALFVFTFALLGLGLAATVTALMLERAASKASSGPTAPSGPVRMAWKAMGLCAVLLSLLYPLTTFRALEVTHCRTDVSETLTLVEEGGGSTTTSRLVVQREETLVLVSNPLQVCYDDEHTPVAGMGWAIVILFSLGFPAGLALGLRQRILRHLDVYVGFPDSAKSSTTSPTTTAPGSATTPGSVAGAHLNPYFRASASSKLVANARDPARLADGAKAPILPQDSVATSPSGPTSRPVVAKTKTPRRVSLAVRSSVYGVLAMDRQSWFEWVPPSMDVQPSVYADPALDPFLGSDFRPSRAWLRVANLVVNGVLAVIAVFWVLGSGQGDVSGNTTASTTSSTSSSLSEGEDANAIGRAAVQSVVLAAFAGVLMSSNPYIAIERWKRPVKVGSLIVSILGTWLITVVALEGTDVEDGSSAGSGSTILAWITTVASLLLFLLLFVAFLGSLLLSMRRSYARLQLAQGTTTSPLRQGMKRVAMEGKMAKETDGRGGDVVIVGEVVDPVRPVGLFDLFARGSGSLPRRRGTPDASPSPSSSRITRLSHVASGASLASSGASLATAPSPSSVASQGSQRAMLDPRRASVRHGFNPAMVPRSLLATSKK